MDVCVLDLWACNPVWVPVRVSGFKPGMTVKSCAGQRLHTWSERTAWAMSVRRKGVLELPHRHQIKSPYAELEPKNTEPLFHSKSTHTHRITHTHTVSLFYQVQSYSIIAQCNDLWCPLKRFYLYSNRITTNSWTLNLVWLFIHKRFIHRWDIAFYYHCVRCIKTKAGMSGCLIHIAPTHSSACPRNTNRKLKSWFPSRELKISLELNIWDGRWCIQVAVCSKTKKY